MGGPPLPRFLVWTSFSKSSATDEASPVWAVLRGRPSSKMMTKPKRGGHGGPPVQDLSLSRLFYPEVRSRIFHYRFCIDCDLDFVAHYNATFV